MDTGIFVARMILGLSMAAHGGQKLFGWFGGPGLKGTAGFMEMFRFRPAGPFAFALAFSEFGGGLLTAVGLFGPVGPSLMILVMIVALVVAHLQHGFFAATNGIEFTLIFAAGALAVAAAGTGTLSLDAWLGINSFWTGDRTATVILAGVAGALLTLATRRRSSAPAGALVTE